VAIEPGKMEGNVVSVHFICFVQVSKYLSSSVSFPPAGTFNRTNRVYPDVAAFGARILVVANGNVSVSAG
jgi:hypothetical protein